ncbi:MAG: hypothetical protein H8E53_09175 [Planctomycetes bacterium]|nr:hypothetical protein [Planctomycetota bacterium]
MKSVKSLLVVVCLSLFGFGTAQAAVETFDSYATHTNTTNSGDPGEALFSIYGDSPSQVIGTWEGDVGDGGDGLTGAGIGSNGQDIYAFGTGGGSGLDAGQDLGIMDFGMHDWGMTSGVIADYLGPDGLDLHGGTLDVRALLQATNFSGQIRLGFVSDSQHDRGDGPENVEFTSPAFAITDSFAWYHGELNSFLSDVDGTTSYGASPGVKVLGVWVDLFNSDAVTGTVSGELRIDQIELTPEPASLVILMAGCTALLKQRAKRRRRS